MKTLIVYGSKHGCTRKCAEQLSQNFPAADVIDVAKTPTITLDTYATVLIGSSVYVGQINKRIREFCQANLPALRQKRLGLFVCCGQSEKAMEQLEAGFPPELVQVASAKGYFGYDFTHLSFVEKAIAKAVGAPVGTADIRSADITSFAQTISREA